ncbi:cell-cycle control medial ring component-domain-containing protein [Calycina marina]|uniref:Cell-cycle control medial ring component-domain-containing protein n=1 Tax=Calycina marina TaxID=1763456 RepID=A0A9P7YXQ0_9HELO|nr:cell-cycle control medial ring component-domain-containing protein [Calycina marina]
MTELTFARQFLQTLDSKPAKLSPDHVEDPRNYPARGAYILPKQPDAFKKKSKPIHGAEKSYTITLKSLRNPPLDITLSSQAPNTSILSLKTAIEAQTSIPLSALRILHKKKPVGDSKVLKDLVGEEEVIDFSVMVIGGAAVLKKSTEEFEVPGAAQGESGHSLLAKGKFWEDLKGFLVQGLRDEGEGEKVYGMFRKAYENSK